MSQVHERFVQALAQVSAVSKDKKNTFHNYSYRGIDDVMNALHGVLADVGLFYTPRLVAARYDEWATKKGDRQQVATLDYEFVFYAEDGTSLTVGPVVGQAADTDDKAPMKALSQAAKYALLQAFCIPTEDVDDPDAASPVSDAGGRTEPDEAHQALLNSLNVLLDSAEAMGLEVDRTAAVEFAAHTAGHAQTAVDRLEARIEEAKNAGNGEPERQVDPDAAWLDVDHLRKQLAIPRPRMLTHARLIVDQDDLDDDSEGRIAWESADDVGPDAHPQVLRGLKSWLEDLAVQKAAS